MPFRKGREHQKLALEGRGDGSERQIYGFWNRIKNMPMYEYLCSCCGTSFEKLRRMQDADDPLPCPDCQSEEVELQLSTFATSGCSTSGSGRFT